MASTRYGVPYWSAQLPRGRRPRYARLRGAQTHDVVIVGGGLTGCATAYAFAAAGVSVALVEADDIGLAATTRGSGAVRLQPAADFLTLEQRWGRRAARAVWQMTRRAALDLAATVRRLGLRCQLETTDAITIALSDEQAQLLQRELRARRKAGLDGMWLSRPGIEQATSIEAVGGLRTKGGVQLDPLRLCLGLAASAQKRGAVLHERSRVVKVKPGRHVVDIAMDGGTVQAQRVIVTTDAPTPLYASLARHVAAWDTYMVMTPPLGAKVRREMGRRDAALSDRADPAHYLRWTRDHRVLFGGGDQVPPPKRTHDRVLIQRTGQLMYELSTLYPVISGIRPDYAWTAPVTATPDGVMFVGPHRHYPRHLFALGTGHGGAAASFLASRLLLRHHLGRSDKGDELFGFSR